MRAPVGALNWADRQYGIGRGLAAIRPSGVLPRFCWWCLHSAIAELRSRATGSTYEAIAAEDIETLRFPAWSASTQRAITDFLDAETARIDVLIAKKRRLIDRLAERRSGVISHHLWSRPHRPVRLKYLSGPPTSGNRDHSSFTPDDTGVPCLRGLNIRPGRIEARNLLRITRQDHERLPRTKLYAGDLVIVRSGNAGSAAVIPSHFGDANCVDLVVVRRSARLNPSYLEYDVNSREAQEQVTSKSAGALLTHFNAVDAGDLIVPYVDLNEQDRVVQWLDDQIGRIESTRHRLETQVDLLQEHRLAVITAAVTGELEIPGADA